MSRVVDHSLEQAIASGTVNQYMLSLYQEPRLDDGDLVEVPKDRLRHYIRKAKVQLRDRAGVVQQHMGDKCYLVRFEACGTRSAFEKIIPLANLTLLKRAGN